MEAKEIEELVRDGFELSETHISWILMGQEVFKIKKPVKFSFLDFSTIERREYFCNEEVRLNRRLSPEVYLGVVSVVRSEKGLVLEGNTYGEIIDYAVKMKKLNEECKMSKLLASDSIGECEVKEIVEKIAAFHNNTKRVSDGSMGSFQMISEQVMDLGSYRQTIDKASGFGNWVDNILRCSQDFLRRNKKLIEKRANDGYVRDCHGDLHMGNIFFDNGLKIIDCIEFSNDFRCIDVVSDIAFMAMDLDFAGRSDLSDFFVESYLEKTKDPELETLLPFYKCYRANVRAKIATIEWMGKKDNKVREMIDRYVLLSERYAKSL